MSNSSVHARTPWWVAFPVTILLFVLTDLALAIWVPNPARLPETFSPAYLQRYADSLRSDRNLVVVLGDSVLWGYKIPQQDSLPALLARQLPHDRIVNLSYEGGSTTNSEMVLRYLLSCGVRPRLVIFNVNSKEMNPGDSAYRRLQPALELASHSILEPVDRADLTLLPPKQINDRIGDFVERWWRLYRYRVDIRAHIFGTDDMATYLTALANRVTGYTARREAEHRPTADRFFATYDMTPLDDSNVAFRRMKRMAKELHDNRIASLAFLSPTNHPLLHEYIDVPEYQDNLRTVSRTLLAGGVPVVNLDRAIPGSEFIDNDHMTPEGNRLLLRLLLPSIQAALK